MLTIDESKIIKAFEKAICWHSKSISADDFERILNELPPIDETWRERYRHVAREALFRAEYSLNDFQKFQLLLCHSPECAKVKDDRDGTLLHEACRMQDCPLEIIQLLIDTWPPAVLVEDSFGWLPFHCACIQWNFKLLKLLLPYTPHAVQVKDTRGRLPLHLVCHLRLEFLRFSHGFTMFHGNRGYRWVGYGNNVAPDLVPHNVLEFLMDEHPHALKCQDQDGHLPLHYACTGTVSQESLNLMLQHYPDGVHVADKNGRLALHMACLRRDPSVNPSPSTRYSSPAFDGNPSASQELYVQSLVKMGETTVLKNAFSKWSPVDLVCYSSPALIAYLQQSVQKIEPVAKREFVSFAEDKLGLPDLVVSLIWRFAAPRKRQGDVLGKVLANALYQELNALDKLDEKIEDTVIEVENKLSNTRQGTEIVLKDCDQTFKPWRDRNLRAYSRRLGRYTRLGGGFCRRCPNARRHLGKKINDDVKAQEEREKQKLEEEKQKLAEKEAEERLKEKLEEEKQKQAEKANLEEEKILDESDLIKQPLARARGELDVVQAELEQKATAAQADMDGPQKLKDFLKRFEASIAAGVAKEIRAINCIAFTDVKVEVILLLSEEDLPCPLK